MTEQTQLTVIERAAVALTSTERETTLRELVAKSTDMVEIKNAAARDQVHGAAMVLRTARTDIQKAAKAARDDANAFSKAVIAEENRLIAITEPEEKRLLSLRDAWDEEREAEKRAKLEAEQRRVAEIRGRIADIGAQVTAVAGKSAAHIESVIRIVVALQIDVEHFAELTGEAEMARGTTLDKLRELHAAAVAQEAEAARLAAEREELERQRAELAAQREREEAERAERERIAAEQRAVQEQAAAAMRKQQEEHEARMRAQQEELDRQRAVIEAERQRQADEAARIEREKQAAIEAEAARVEAEVRAKREAEEAEAARIAQEEADRIFAEQQRIEAERRAAEAERIRREQVEFEANGPEPTEILEVLANNWDVSTDVVLHWLTRHAWAALKEVA
ncbi:hypothetical protein [Burkholderia pseudomallei]|uniref:hypothetical protein n=1 Tax=Burkholderia pseudomallei TaxID=28450 RepID=UPI001F4548F4|nr:hypothetical protein [Burkholderia pseudomallei]